MSKINFESCIFSYVYTIINNLKFLKNYTTILSLQKQFLNSIKKFKNQIYIL